MHHILIYLHIGPEGNINFSGTKKQRSLEDRAVLCSLKRAWGGFKRPGIIKFQSTTKWFRWSKTATEIGITRLSHGNSCGRTDRTLSLQTAKREDFIYVPVSLSLTLSLSVFLKRRGCLLNHQFQGVPFLFCQPQVIFTPSLRLPVPPPIHPSLSKRTLCANLYSLSHAKHLSCPHWMPLQSNQHLSGCKAF